MDIVKVISLKVYVQDNGIVRRESDGLLLGRLDGVTFEELQAVEHRLAGGLCLACRGDKGYRDDWGGWHVCGVCRGTGKTAKA